MHILLLIPIPDKTITFRSSPGYHTVPPNMVPPSKTTGLSIISLSFFLHLDLCSWPSCFEAAGTQWLFLSHSVCMISHRVRLRLVGEAVMSVVLRCPFLLKNTFSISMKVNCFFSSLALFAVCLAAVTVNVLPKVEVIKGETVKLPCTFSTSEPAASLVVQWFIVSTYI